MKFVTVDLSMCQAGLTLIICTICMVMPSSLQVCT